MSQVISGRRLTLEAGVRAQSNSCGNCAGKSGTGTDISPSTSVFLLSVLFFQRSVRLNKTNLTLSRLRTYIYIYMTYRTANLQTFHFKYLFNKYPY
jgi:hypothetical protein